MNIQQDFKILSFSTSETKMKKMMGNFTLEAVATGETVSAKMWEEELTTYEKRYFKPNNIIYVEDGTYSEQYKNLIIKRMSLIQEALSGLSEEKRDELYNELITVAKEIKDENLSKAILKEIEEYEELLKIAPAAKNNHHNYVGGLLKHTLECVNIAACIMHDFGKIFEYKIDLESGFVEIDEEFIKTWVSHTLYGFSWANQNGFKQLARVIAAHHGRKDWGAIIDLDEKNIEPDLYLMHHIDDISAKFGAIKAEDL